MDASERTCKLCVSQVMCGLKNAIVQRLKLDEKIVGDDYDDILVDLGAICEEFKRGETS